MVFRLDSSHEVRERENTPLVTMQTLPNVSALASTVFLHLLTQVVRDPSTYNMLHSVNSIGWIWIQEVLTKILEWPNEFGDLLDDLYNHMHLWDLPFDHTVFYHKQLRTINHSDPLTLHRRRRQIIFVDESIDFRCKALCQSLLGLLYLFGGCPAHTYGDTLNSIAQHDLTKTYTAHLQI